MMLWRATSNPTTASSPSKIPLPGTTLHVQPYHLHWQTDTLRDIRSVQVTVWQWFHQQAKTKTEYVLGDIFNSVDTPAHWRRTLQPTTLHSSIEVNRNASFHHLDCSQSHFQLSALLPLYFELFLSSLQSIYRPLPAISCLLHFLISTGWIRKQPWNPTIWFDTSTLKCSRWY